MNSNYYIVTSIINARFQVEDLNKLEEPNVMTVKVEGIPKNALLTLYRFDPNNEDIFPFFERGMALRLICDYVLLVDYNDFLYVLLIELKRGSITAKKQLNATEELIRYVISSALRIKQEIDQDKIYIRKIRISERRHIRKTNSGDIEYDENNYIDYPWDSFHVRYMLK